MQFTRARRVVAGLAVVAAALAVTPAPAAAAAKVSMYVGDVTTAAGADGGTQVKAYFYADTPVSLAGPKLTYELVGAPSGVTLNPDSSDCTSESATKVVCSQFFPIEAWPGGMGTTFDVSVVAAASASPGAGGTLRTTFASTSIASIRQDSRVRVAEKVDLTAGPALSVSAAPGGSFDAPLVVSNTGDKLIVGAVIRFDHDRALVPAARHRNCLYIGDALQSCRFDQTLDPGATYTAAASLQVRADTRAPGRAFGSRSWHTIAQQEDFEAFLKAQGIDPGTPGDGPDLAVIKQRSRLVLDRPTQSDPNTEDNYHSVHVTVTGTNGVDLAAAGATVTGATGAVVDLPVGARNVGKATLDLTRPDTPAAATTIVVPPKTTVTAAPAECYPFVDGRVNLDKPGAAGAASYRCYSDPVMAAGAAELHAFKLRLDAVTESSTGSVAVNEPCTCDYFKDDIDTSNNKAAITVTVTAAPTGTPTSAGPGGGGNSDGDGAGTGAGGDGPGGDAGGEVPGENAGNGGPLPLTGPAAMGIAGGGLLLLVLGAGGVLLARRRRATFVS